MKEEQQEIRKYFREQQEKYTYYIIALCVAAIGFSIHKTIDLPIKISQIPLGVAVISWGGSIYCGLKFKKYIIASLYNNHEYINIVNGKNKEIGDNPSKIESAKKIIEEILQGNEKIGIQLSKWQDRLFIVGFISFLIWHVLEMYLITIA